MTKEQWMDKLNKLNACSEAVRWFETQPDMETAWRDCQRGDWMLWLLGRLAVTKGDRKRMVPAVAGCARLPLKYVPDGENRPRVAIETYEAWGRGEATIEQVRAAVGGAYVVDAAAAAAYAAYAAYAAAAAAAAAASAADVAYAAAVSAAAAAAAAAAARSVTLARCADIVRLHFEYPTFKIGVSHE